MEYGWTTNNRKTDRWSELEWDVWVERVAYIILLDKLSKTECYVFKDEGRLDKEICGVGLASR